MGTGMGMGIGNWELASAIWMDDWRLLPMYLFIINERTREIKISIIDDSIQSFLPLLFSSHLSSFLPLLSSFLQHQCRTKETHNPIHQSNIRLHT